ncbi:MlaD family protein [Hufsiella ginkgonis]|uniref:MCE family protein n=1 Tax=Hufsiella ginkgonis TaxID=2695274 RepID=A0A7K1Y220_9SPHI|nr:MlaD family protein [Hufsiella ginkgonis]MXV17323.1 MCE family protein [Hufsiella ginkgonis]
MDKSENKRAVIVGIFLLLGLLILVAGVFTLGGQQKRFVKSVKVEAIFDDVQGLKVGNNVWFSGVKIGTVKSIEFFGGSEVRVLLNIEEAAHPYIRKDAKAKISSEGLIGNRIIVIYDGTPSAPQIAEGGRLGVDHALTTDEMMATLQENNKNLLDITNDFKLLSLKIVKGKGTAGAFLTDSLMGEQFKSIVANMQLASANTNKVSAAVVQLTSKINSKGALANELLTDTTIFRDLKIAAAQLKEATSSATGITENLRKTSERLNANDNALGVLLNDPVSATTIKTTLTNLESSSKKLDESMEALQHNFLLRGFFKKKEKDGN